MPMLGFMLQISRRDSELTMSVMMKRIAPTAINAERWRSFVASLNSLAMSDAIV